MHPVLVYIAAKAVTLGAYGCWRLAKKRRRERERRREEELWQKGGPVYDLRPDGSVSAAGGGAGRTGEACRDDAETVPVRKGGAG